MYDRKGRLSPAFLLAGLLLVALAASLGFNSAAATNRRAANPGDLVILAWNDLGMHCYNTDFADLAVLPPFNNLWVQVLRVGDPPQFVNSGITVSYSYAKNTESASKTNFWQYEDKLFGVNLPLNVGLKGNGMAGVMQQTGDHFVAEGIPVTEYNDNDPTKTRHPYQVATVVVRNATSGQVLAQQQVVTPVSSEMRCDTCHSDTGAATVGNITPTGDVEQNILALHDKEEMGNYPTGHQGALMNRRPVLCAECHASNALGLSGVPPIKSLSQAMHSKHAEEGGFTNDTNGCYNCHPGPVTRCLRDVMSQDGMQCQGCHGTLAQVAQGGRDPWKQEPRCDNSACHGSAVHQDQALYRQSHGHGQVYCAACHDSPHAIAPSREPNDQIKFLALQGSPDTLGKDNRCTVCHATQPSGSFTHSPSVLARHSLYLPLTRK